MNPTFPHLIRHDTHVDFMVNARSTLLLGGELRNSSTSTLEFMEPIWPHLKKLQVKMVLLPVSWRQFEPEEGRFDPTLLEGLIRRSREEKLHVGLLWLATWKNGFSGYAPTWLWRDPQRFPRMSAQALSPFGEATLAADQRAFRRMMEVVKTEDCRGQTVVAIQVENEIGLLGDSRDRSPAAQRAFAENVPRELTCALDEYEVALKPELRDVWVGLGRLCDAPWSEVFGDGPLTDEIFMAWHMARFTGAVAQVGKAVHPLPMFVNAWTVDPRKPEPGVHPSGGPVSRMLDVWKAAAPAIDLFGVDNYREDFKTECGRYAHRGNPVFVPEAAGWWGGDDPRSAIAKAFYTIGSGALGYCLFGIDNLFYENGLLGEAYAVLNQLEPLIVNARKTGRMRGFYRAKDEISEELRLGDYRIKIHYALEGVVGQMFETGLRNEGDYEAYGLILQDETDDGTFWLAGRGYQADFKLAVTTGVEEALLVNLGVEEGCFVHGEWKVNRVLNGDEVPEQGTGGVKLPPSAYPVIGEPAIAIQKVRFLVVEHS